MRTSDESTPTAEEVLFDVHARIGIEILLLHSSTGVLVRDHLNVDQSSIVLDNPIQPLSFKRSLVISVNEGGDGSISVHTTRFLGDTASDVIGFFMVVMSDGTQSPMDFHRYIHHSLNSLIQVDLIRD